VEAFLARHWARPLAPQGPAPAGFSPQEAALDANSCGACHAQQLADWRTTLHAGAMGPGVLGQLLDMAPEALEEHQGCIRCHAPLAEQAMSLSEAIAKPQARDRPAPLHEQGLTCAACHVRGHERFGPLRRDGSAPKAGEGQLPHGGWKASAAFEDSRFCAACHQFAEGDFALNGKLLENTYEEWKASRYAREGKSCQSCHMPDRRHLWRGVHDEQAMKAGVTIRTTPPIKAGDTLEASLAIRNTGTGHHFPTYVTPKVIAEIYQADAAGAVLQGTLQQHVIARLVELDLSREIADTRLAPDEEAALNYRRRAHPRAASLVYRVRVEPDAFYTGFYESLLANNQTVRGRQLIGAALEHSRRAQFTFFEERRALQ
jgi:nitrate/TMAO reductase-like tetraheme cytochrome c subunit